jgi:hypothetical protein
MAGRRRATAKQAVAICVFAHPRIANGFPTTEHPGLRYEDRQLLVRYCKVTRRLLARRGQRITTDRSWLRQAATWPPTIRDFENKLQSFVQAAKLANRTLNTACYGEYFGHQRPISICPYSHRFCLQGLPLRHLRRNQSSRPFDRRILRIRQGWRFAARQNQPLPSPTHQ